VASVRDIRDILAVSSGCALRRDAHHTTVPVATATILTARLSTHLEGKPVGEPAERARRENRTSGGDRLVASGRYITCVLPTAVLNVCDLLPLHLALGKGKTVESFPRRIPDRIPMCRSIAIHTYYLIRNKHDRDLLRSRCCDT